MFAEIYVKYPVEGPFTYRVPEGMTVLPGTRVLVNFAGRSTRAFVSRIISEHPVTYKIKDIEGIIDEEAIFDERLIACARFVSESYLSTTGEAISMALPSGLKPSARYKIPFERSPAGPINLTPEQKGVHEDISTGYEEGKRLHLIFGITGSGKTEVYMETARAMIAEGRSVIYCVPEISLSSQIFERLYALFGDELIIYHSHLTANQRLHNWKRFYSGEAKIAVGTRSAVFLQCPDLGLIIIDEEHDGSYKENSSPRYNARSVAFYRSSAESAMVILGSATPSLESLYACDKGTIQRHILKERYGGATVPEIEIVEIDSPSPSKILSTPLRLFTKKAVDRGFQAVYLINRRGFSPILYCTECAWKMECPHCSIRMNYHRGGNMVCHYCGYQRSAPAACPECGAKKLVKVGSGTQRIEEVITDYFKDYRVFRLDQDSSRKKGTVPELIQSMKAGEIDILLGTQLVAKGFDFHSITVAGVLLADIGMDLPDFRATERTFSLIMQLAGRSGRGSEPGKVIVQTLNADRPIFQYIKNHDYFGFYRSEIEARKLMRYPPYSRLARLLVRGPDEAEVQGAITKLKKALDTEIKNCGADIILLGPSSAPLTKISKNYRYHIILKAENAAELREVIRGARGAVTGNSLYLEVDIDPYDLL